MAGLTAALGAAMWLGVALIAQRLQLLSILGVGALHGWAAHRAMGQHRTALTGAIAASATLVALVVGYGLLWLSRVGLGRSTPWYDIVAALVGVVIAYGLAGARKR